MHMETDPGPNIDVDALGGPPVRVSVVRGGQTLPGAQGQGQSVDLTNVAAQVGDQIVVEQPPGTVVGAAPYDELPTFDNPVCLGDTAETATVGDAMSVFGTAYTGLLTGTPPPAASSLGDGKATFTFGAPVSTGMFVQAETFRHLGSLDVNSERSVIARDCNSVAVPGLPPVPPPGPGVPGRVDSVPP